MADQEPLSKTVIQRQLGWLGHVLRRDDNRIVSNYAMHCPQHGHRKRGRPRLTYQRYISNITGVSDTVQLRNTAHDRQLWRDLVVGCSAVD